MLFWAHHKIEYTALEIRVVLGCVFNFMMCSKVICTGLIKTGIQMVIFSELVQYAKNLGGKSLKNLVEHQIIKNDKKI